jgi:predicted transposase/invertase (TIGR01784 family)
MKTDSLFYRLFQAYPAVLFELLGQPSETAQGYRFQSVEVKQLAFRIDGVFISDLVNQPIYFLEVQFQKDEQFYERTLSEIFLYLGQSNSEREWQFVILFAKRSIAPPLPVAYRLLLPNIKIIYLTELAKTANQTLGIQAIDLVVCSLAEAKIKAPMLLAMSQNLRDEGLRRVMIDLIESVLIYKFDRLSREELEAMFGLSELKQTRFYQEARSEGEQIGIQKGEQIGRQEGKREEAIALILRQLSRRPGALSRKHQALISNLTLEQLESLGDALLDFSSLADLEAFLSQYS